jgi:hypothetical protein
MAAVPAAADAPLQAKTKSGWERAVGKFSSYFEERGVGPQDIPAAIVLHEVGSMHRLAQFRLAAVTLEGMAAPRVTSC